MLYFDCFLSHLHKHISLYTAVLRLFHIKVLPNLWEYVNIKAGIISVSLPFSPPLCGHKKMHACRNTQTKINLWENAFGSYCFPTIFPRPFSLYSDLIRLQGMQLEWRHRDKYTAEIWVSASKRLAHWHQEIDGSGGRHGNGREKQQEVEYTTSKAGSLFSNDALKCATCSFIMFTEQKKQLFLNTSKVGQ